MTAVCTSAAIRRYKAEPKRSSAKPFHAPLSRDYIRDRIDIDDPLNGYQIRHRTGGWLQGFVLWTNFTTWTHDFKWDSEHPVSGIASTKDTTKVDADGSLARDLESQTRSGDPHLGGIVFPAIAEIGLVGGLGCGEYLLRMALESIRETKKYKYVVLQATDQSKTFYEKYGFVRVGAICRYGLAPAEVGSGGEIPIVGYRHWTHANESETSLQKHGGPSYMMCLKLPEKEGGAAAAHSSVLCLDSSSSECSDCGRPLKRPAGQPADKTFLDHMLSLVVEQKPTIEQLGGSFSPGPKVRRGSQTGSGAAAAAAAAAVAAELEPHALNGAKRKRHGRRNSRTGPNLRHADSFDSVKSEGSSTQLPTKRRRLSNGSAKPIFASPPRQQLPQKIPQQMQNESWAEAAAAAASAAKKALGRPPRPASSTPSVTKSRPTKRKSTAGGKAAQKDFAIQPSVTTSAIATVDSKNRAFHSVRGPSGRFVNVPIIAPIRRPSDRPSNRTTGSTIKDTTKNKPKSTDNKKKKKKTPLKSPPPKPASSSPPEAERGIGLGRSDGKPVPIKRTELMKQKVKSYPRSRVHYYNRVVKAKNAPAGKATQYYFVLHYSESSGMIRIAPMVPRGRLSGKHEGRPRYQVVVEDTDANFLTVPISGYQVVPASMIMKTPVVASEAWDVEE